MKVFSLVLLVSCTVMAVHGSSMPKPCPKVAEPKLKEGCVNREDKDLNGCTTWTTHCITSDPPRQSAEISIALPRVSRAVDCPEVGIPKVEEGCKITSGKDQNGCDTWSIECVSVYPPHHRVARDVECPAVGNPKVEEGCTLISGTDANGCPTWSISCNSPNTPHHVKRSTTEGFVCGSNVCTKKERCESGKCFPCPLVLPQEPKPGCHLERTQEPGQCPRIFQKCPEVKPDCPAVGIPKPDEGCTLESEDDENGCPGWVMKCPPGQRGKRFTRPADGFVCGSNVCSKKQRCQSGKCFPCPLVLPQQPKPGCHLERTQEPGQCPRIFQKCPEVKPDCPAVGIPKPDEGCTLESADDNGCPVWVMRCPPKHRGKRAAKAVDGFVCGSNVCSKKQRCESGNCFPCPLVFPPEPKPGCHLERTQEPGQCPKIFQRCPDDKPRNKRATEEKKPAAQKPKCPKNAEYRECTNFCPDKSCANYLTPSACFSLRCGPPSCVCKEGHVLMDHENKEKGCVERETCRKLAQLAEAKKKIGSN